MANAASLGKPKVKGSDGNFTFRMPTKEQMDEQRGGSRQKLPHKTWHQMKVTNVTFDPSSKSGGNPMWVWDFIIVAGEYAGQTFKLWTALTDGAAWKVQETLEALGQDCPPGEEIVLDRQAVIGTACEGLVVDSTQNEDFSSLDKIRPHPKGAGYRPGKLKVEEEEFEEFPGSLMDDDDEPVPPRRPAKPAARSASAGRGKAPVSLGKKRR